MARLECQTKRERRLKPRSRPGRPRKQLPMPIRLEPFWGKWRAFYLIDGAEISIPIPGSTVGIPISKAEAAELTREVLENMLANKQLNGTKQCGGRTAEEAAAADRMLGIVPNKQTAPGAPAEKPPGKAIRKNPQTPSPEVQTPKPDQGNVSPKVAGSEPVGAAAESTPEVIRTVANSTHTSSQTEHPNGSTNALRAQPQTTVSPDLKVRIARLEELLKGSPTTGRELAGYLNSESINACGIGPEQEAYLRDRLAQHVTLLREGTVEAQLSEYMFDPVMINGKSVTLAPPVKVEVEAIKMRAIQAVKACVKHEPERCQCWWERLRHWLIRFRKRYGDGSDEVAYADQIWTEVENIARDYKPAKAEPLSKSFEALSKFEEDDLNAAPE